MKSSDKLLLAIVGGIILLVIVTLVVTLSRPEPEYRTDDDPEAVVHNYLLALQKEDYGTAYKYLSPKLKGYPGSVETFHDSILKSSWNFRLDREAMQSTEPATIVGNHATVSVNETIFRGGDLFESYQSTKTFEMRLQFESGGWKIVDSSYYFAWCWDRDDGCN